jgi:hypothetical protein
MKKCEQFIVLQSNTDGTPVYTNNCSEPCTDCNGEGEDWVVGEEESEEGEEKCVNISESRFNCLSSENGAQRCWYIGPVDTVNTNGRFLQNEPEYPRCLTLAAAQSQQLDLCSSNGICTRYVTANNESICKESCPATCSDSNQALFGYTCVNLNEDESHCLDSEGGEARTWNGSVCQNIADVTPEQCGDARNCETFITEGVNGVRENLCESEPDCGPTGELPNVDQDLSEVLDVDIERNLSFTDESGNNYFAAIDGSFQCDQCCVIDAA